MGSGIAQVFAQAGYLVSLTDVEQEALDRSRATIQKSLERLAQKGTISDSERPAVLNRIVFSRGLG
jgi:3-hydroxybutyryl-CoA dehydrogenase